MQVAARRGGRELGARAFSVFWVGMFFLGSTGWCAASELLDAAQAGDAARVAAALKADATQVDSVDADGNTALILAAKAGSAPAVGAVLAAKPAVNHTNHHNQTALWTAVTSRHGGLAPALIAAGARVDCMADTGLTPLHVAVGHGDLALVKLLVGKGANVNYLTRRVVREDEAAEIQGVESQSSLMLAVIAGQPEMVAFLLEKHADVGVRALTAGRREEPSWGRTSLHYAAEKGDLPSLAALLQAGAEINAADMLRQAPLHLAVAAGQTDCVNALLDAKADATLASRGDQQAIDLVADDKNGAAIQAVFAKHGIKPDHSRSAINALKGLATAQAQFIKKEDFYSPSGAALSAAGGLIPKELALAFEAWQGNGDAAKPVAYKGYIFRMLQGFEEDGRTSFWKDTEDVKAGMNTWACIARPADGQGDQYFISEVGYVYKKADPGKEQFLLEGCLPMHPQGQAKAEIDGWVPAR